MVRRLVLLGPPGVGKGTMAALLAAKHGLLHISTGAIFRAEVAAQTPTGQEVKRILEAGGLVPDAITNAIVAQVIASADAQNGFILDGYPRTVAQAEFLLHHINGLEAVILLEATSTTLMHRLLQRGRADDTPATIAERIRHYETMTAPLIDFFATRNLLYRVNAEGSIEENFVRLLAKVSREN